MSVPSSFLINSFSSFLLISVVRVIPIKDALTRKQENPNVQNVRGHMLHLIKGVLHTKNRHFNNNVVNSQKSYAAAVGHKPLTQPRTPQTILFNSKQLTKFVANVVIQIAQPQVCYSTTKQDMSDLKSSMCRKISNAAKNVLSVDITGKDLFESIGSLSAPALLNPSNSRVPRSTRLSKPPQNHPSP